MPVVAERRCRCPEERRCL